MVTKIKIENVEIAGLFKTNSGYLRVEKNGEGVVSRITLAVVVTYLRTNCLNEYTFMPHQVTIKAKNQAYLLSEIQRNAQSTYLTQFQALDRRKVEVENETNLIVYC